MKYFLDTEFIESGAGKPIQLISIGIVAEDGREFYAISWEFNWQDANDWVRANVLEKLELEIKPRSLGEIASAIVDFVGDDKPEFWGYYADYDWVVFCQIFGAMVDLPKGWPMYCRDLKQWSDAVDAPKFEAPKGEHNALVDAKWNVALYEHIRAWALR
jgi:3' exoribonuclease, RNase T-like